MWTLEGMGMNCKTLNMRPSASGTLVWHCHRHQGCFCGTAMSHALAVSLQIRGPGCCQLESSGTTSLDLKLRTFLALVVLKTLKVPLFWWELLRSLVLKRSYQFWLKSNGSLTLTPILVRDSHCSLPTPQTLANGSCLLGSPEDSYSTTTVSPVPSWSYQPSRRCHCLSYHSCWKWGVAVWMETIPHRLMCLKIWSPIGGLFGKFLGHLGGGSLLKEICHWIQALRLL